MSLKEEITSIAREIGIDKVGFTSKERLKDAPPSGDLGYILPSARSAISLVVALDKAAIRAFLGKEDQITHDNEHKVSYMKLRKAGEAIERLLRDRGATRHHSPTPTLNTDKASHESHRHSYRCHLPSAPDGWNT